MKTEQISLHHVVILQYT